MFFLITHLVIDKYYPQIFTQFIIGVVCYIIVFLVLSELVPTMTYTEYKYHLYSLIGIDLAYLVYVAKFQKTFFPFNTIGVPEPNSSSPTPLGEPTPLKSRMVSPTLTSINNNLDALRLECISDKLEPSVVKSPKKSETQSPTRSISFTSEINDFRITHDPSLEDNEEGVIFSNSDRQVNKSSDDMTTSLNVSDIVSK